MTEDLTLEKGDIVAITEAFIRKTPHYTDFGFVAGDKMTVNLLVTDAYMVLTNEDGVAMRDNETGVVRFEQVPHYNCTSERKSGNGRPYNCTVEAYSEMFARV